MNLRQMTKQLDKLSRRQAADDQPIIGADFVDFDTDEVFRKECEIAGKPCCLSNAGQVNYRPCTCKLVVVGTAKDMKIRRLREESALQSRPSRSIMGA